jgi:hypothetical protein
MESPDAAVRTSNVDQLCRCSVTIVAAAAAAAGVFTFAYRYDNSH